MVEAYVTHVSRQRNHEKDAWIIVPFLSQIQGESIYHFGYDVCTEFSEEEIRGWEKIGSLKRLENQVKMAENQSLWQTPTGEIFLAKRDDPIGDTDKKFITRVDDKGFREYDSK
ncbi:hypothetical protein HYZ97_01030 [Candidatus Pacearchaeota archaeon]|nr:hypothetical protein [Candidatus Pacearchaeota archaeon]